MHPVTQAIVAVSCLALVGMGGYVVYDLREDRGLEARETRQEATDDLLSDARDATCAAIRVAVASGENTVTPGGWADQNCF